MNKKNLLLLLFVTITYVTVTVQGMDDFPSQQNDSPQLSGEPLQQAIEQKKWLLADKRAETERA